MIRKLSVFLLIFTAFALVSCASIQKKQQATFSQNQCYQIKRDQAFLNHKYGATEGSGKIAAKRINLAKQYEKRCK